MRDCFAFVPVHRHRARFRRVTELAMTTRGKLKTKAPGPIPRIRTDRPEACPWSLYIFQAAAAAM